MAEEREKTRQEKIGEKIEKTGARVERLGKAAQASGKAAEIGGRVMARAGGAMERGGQALSKTRLGAVVGAPMTAGGAAVRRAGATTEKAGRGVEKAGLRARTAGAGMKQAGGALAASGREAGLSKTTFLWMLAVAILADLASAGISLLPAIGQVINPIFSFVVALTFWFWFAWLGLGWRGLWGSGMSMAVEVVPFLQALPTFTAMVVVIYLKSRIRRLPVAGKVVGAIAPGAAGAAALRKAA